MDKHSKPVRKVAGSTGTRTWPSLTRKLPCVTAATETRYFTPICGAAESLHSVRKVQRLPPPPPPYTPFSFSKAAKSPHSVRKVQRLPPPLSPHTPFSFSKAAKSPHNVRKVRLPPIPSPFFVSSFFLQGSKTTAVSVKYVYNVFIPPPPTAARSPHKCHDETQILPHASTCTTVHNFHLQPFMAVKTKTLSRHALSATKITTQRDDETELFSPWTYKSITFTPRFLHNIYPAFCGWQKQTTNFMPCFVGGRITTV